MRQSSETLRFTTIHPYFDLKEKDLKRIKISVCYLLDRAIAIVFDFERDAPSVLYFLRAKRRE